MTDTKQQPLILIVDDVSTNVQLLATALSRLYRIKVANNGPSALTIAQNEQPDLILLDIMMPHMDGFEVLRRLKENTLTDNIPVIFVTADNAESDEERGLSLHFLLSHGLWQHSHGTSLLYPRPICCNRCLLSH